MARKSYLTPMDQVRWARQIAQLRAEDPPVEWREIAKRTNISVRNCQRMHAQLMESGDPDRPMDSMAPIQRHLDVLEVVMQEAAETYSAAPAGSNARVGALRLMMDTSERVIDTMRIVGFLPRQLGALSVEQEVQLMFREFAAMAERHQVPDEFLRDLLVLAESRLTGSRRDQPVLAA